MATSRDFSAGVVWRGLAAGCPLVVPGEAPGPAALRAWLEGRGALAGMEAAHRERPHEALERALERDPATRLAVERGRALARAQPATLATRLAAALGREAPRRAA
jgi:hypothetical protein